MTLANSSAYLIAHAARHALCRLDLDLGSDALTGRVIVSSTREFDSSAGAPPTPPPLKSSHQMPLFSLIAVKAIFVLTAYRVNYCAYQFMRYFCCHLAI